MKKNKSQSHFAKIPSANIPRSTFNRSHGNKLTMQGGDLVPIFVDEALPGDTFKMKATAFGRLATPLKPYMDNMYLDTQFFSVPVRLLWENWEKFNGSQKNPGDSTDFIIPQTVAYTAAEGSLSDYFGLPTGVSNLSHSALFHRAYRLIYNEWYRDENLQVSNTDFTDDGPDPIGVGVVPYKRGKRKDYFTSCLPFPQKGPSVDLPLGDTAPIIGMGKQTTAFDFIDQVVRETDGIGTITYASSQVIDGPAAEAFYVEEDPNNAGFPNLRVDLSNATAATINQLRQSFQLQKLYERDARGGTRYTEILHSHFGVVSDDARLQRPEYLGGGSTPINVNPIAQTSEDLTGTPQGNLAAFATTSMSGHAFNKSFTEHCIVIGLASVRADLTYQTGMNKMFSRKTRADFYWPTYSHLGEQVVTNSEIYFQGTADDDRPFGYQERYAEYRYKPSTICGKFRSSDPQSLDFWHLAQDFASLPVLNDEFIVENPPIDRVIAVPSEPHLLLDLFFEYNCARPMPVYSIPGLIDHF